jgi:SsrA-binding protein
MQGFDLQLRSDMAQNQGGDLVNNRRALHDYEILETYEVGIVLTGTEVKSLRNGGGSLQDAYVKTIDDQLWLIGSSIAPYRYGNIHNHEDRRDRKLLMHKYEIVRLKMWSQEKGMTLIPLAIYLKKGKVKVRIARATGKKQFDKRQTIKDREEKRRLEQTLKRFK